MGWSWLRFGSVVGLLSGGVGGLGGESRAVNYVALGCSKSDWLMVIEEPSCKVDALPESLDWGERSGISCFGRTGLIAAASYPTAPQVFLLHASLSAFEEAVATSYSPRYMYVSSTSPILASHNFDIILTWHSLPDISPRTFTTSQPCLSPHLQNILDTSLSRSQQPHLP